MYCSNCGTKLDDDALFCTKCGTKVEVVAEVAPEPEPSVEQKTEPVAEQKLEPKAEPETVPTVESQATPKVEPEVKEAASTKRQSYFLLIAGGIILLVLLIIAIIQNQKSPAWITSDTYDFNVHTPYTFNYYDYELEDDYEFDCYKLSDRELAKLWDNPPKYAVYGKSTYELDNENLDYFEIDTNGLLWSEEFGSKAGNILKNYNVIILWDEFDGKYHHFDEIFVIKGTQGYGLYKYIDFSKYQW